MPNDDDPPSPIDGNRAVDAAFATCRSDVVDAVEVVCGLAPDDVDDHATLESLGVDSLDLIEIAMIVEERYPIEPQGEDFEGVTTFGAAVATFDRLIRDAAA